jgi:hypothetical protein
MYAEAPCRSCSYCSGSLIADDEACALKSDEIGGSRGWPILEKQVGRGVNGVTGWIRWWSKNERAKDTNKQIMHTA